jgi:hypothetical protein
MKTYKVTVDNGYPTSGTTSWYNEKGQRHREGEPAIEGANGNKEWWINDQRHREDGPAVEWADGDKEWWLNGQRHREDGPAIEWANGTKSWWINGQYYREGGPAIEGANGTKIWYLNGQRHREDGPAVKWADGSKEWWLNGVRHREDGPAVKWADGDKEWWINGEELTEKEFNKRAQHGMACEKFGDVRAELIVTDEEGYRTRTLYIERKENSINFELESVLKQNDDDYKYIDINLDKDDVKKLIEFLTEFTE